MRKTIYVSLLIAAMLVLCIATALADDLNPPPWRGGPRTTFQQWEFNTSEMYPLPDLVMNPAGPPQLSVVPGPSMGWLPNWNGRDGVWQLSGEIHAAIPNFHGGEYKDVVIQLTWWPQLMGAWPNVMEVLSSTQGVNYRTVALENGWWHSTYTMRIFPNPDLEDFRIWGDINVDELVIDTQCVPEPSSLVALGGGLLGMLGIIRRRRS